MMPTRAQIAAALERIAAWSLYIMILLLPISKSIIEITIVTALVSVVLFKVIKREMPKPFSWAEIAVLVTILATIPSIYNSCDLALSVRAFFSKVLKFGALAFVAREALNTRGRLRDFFIMAFLSVIVILGDAAVQHYITHRDLFHYDKLSYDGYPSFQHSEATLLAKGHSPYPRGFPGFPTASFPYPNDFAAWILVVVFPVLTFALARGAPLWRRFVLVAVAAALLLFLVLTKTRSAWVGFAAALCVVPVFGIVRLKKLAAIALVGCLAVGAVIARQSLGPHIIAAAGIVDRQVMWTNGWKIYARHPVIGNGINTFFVNYMQVRQDESAGICGSYAHNCYLQMAADVGLVGLAAFLVMAFLILAQAVRAYRRTDDPFLRSALAGLALGMVAYLVQSFFDTNLFSLNLATLYWLSAGLIFAATASVDRQGQRR